MTIEQITSLRRVARRMGVIGLVAMLLGWAVFTCMVIATIRSRSTPTLAGISYLSWFLGTGIPIIAGILIVFWIAVSLWAKDQELAASVEVRYDQSV
ncbi:MAG: hypothetical protein FWD75_11535 [Propionibacteriaceae bacterium]|nr:hypothetical protein [Propionibacteriaceae bacterium]